MDSQKKAKAKFGLKPYAFFSGVSNLAVAVTLFVVGFLVFSQLFQAFSQDTGNADLDLLLNSFLGILLWPLLIGATIIFVVGGVLMLIVGIMTIVSSFKSDRRNFNGLLIASDVFDGLLLLPLIFFACVLSGNMQILSIILCALVVISFVFNIIDIKLTNRRLKKYEAQRLEEAKTSYEGPNFDNLKNSDSQNTEATQNDQNQRPENNSNGVDFSKLGK